MGEASWIEVKIRTNGEIAEALAEVLGRFTSQGVVVESVTQLNTRTQEQVPTGQVDVYGYLPVDDHIEFRRQKLSESLWHLGRITPIPDPIYTPIRDQNWMAAWKKHYHPIPIGEKVLVMPAWKDAQPGENRLCIRINPAMAFGTGTHPSTQLCLLLMEHFLEPDQPVIDLGCGSGILSIAALKLGASHALALDIDSAAVAATQENARLNEIPPGVLETGQGSLDEIRTGRFSRDNAPCVLVNILAPVIIRLFNEGLGDLVSPGGLIILAGILDHQTEAVLQAARIAGFRLQQRLDQEDWVGLAMEKTN